VSCMGCPTRLLSSAICYTERSLPETLEHLGRNTETKPPIPSVRARLVCLVETGSFFYGRDEFILCDFLFNR
jgi:hypothetical protein